MALLDNRQTGADYTGGASDPRLVNRLALLPVSGKDITAEHVRRAGDQLDQYADSRSLSPDARATLRDMLFGDTFAHHLKEAA